LGAGGAERVMVNMCNYWAAHGKEITLLQLRDDIPDHYSIDEAINLINIGFYWESSSFLFRPRDQFMRVLKLRRAILSTRPDVVISFIDRTNVRVLLSLWGQKLPVIVSERCDPGMNKLGFPWNILRHITYRRAAAVVAQTPTVADWLTTTLNIRQVRVIANAVHKVNVLPFTERRLQVVTVGRLTRQKGTDLLLQSWAKINTHSRWQLSILGDGIERDALEALAERLGISETVRFHGNVANPSEILRQAGVFVLPSRYEGFPNALLEAMACGLAVISFDCPSGPADIIRHGSDGLLVPAEDTRQLTQTIQRLIDDEPLRQALAEQAVEVTTRYSIERIMSEWDELIGHTLGS
jgi:GalNAc-alpha-(1->4)-GalNAc-alpha-(1->3)-diNAcBac-PP-undecaprenol alpha-1,4-N-acetyl-D-galactosaminyltransferase